MKISQNIDFEMKISQNIDFEMKISQNFGYFGSKLVVLRWKFIKIS